MRRPRWAVSPRRSARGRRPGGGEVTEARRRCIAKVSLGSAAEALCTWTSPGGGEGQLGSPGAAGQGLRTGPTGSP
eukprot:1920216-Heterocapsa_arctica.AAC.1